MTGAPRRAQNPPVFRWLNDKILQAIDRRRDASAIVRVRLQGDRLAFEDRLGHRRELGLADIRRVVAVRAEAYAGDETLLLLQAPDDAVIPVAASCDGWNELRDALDRLPGVVPSARWHARLLGAAVGEPLEVWPAPDAAAGTAAPR